MTKTEEDKRIHVVDQWRKYYTECNVPIVDHDLELVRTVSPLPKDATCEECFKVLRGEVPRTTVVHYEILGVDDTKHKCRETACALLSCMGDPISDDYMSTDFDKVTCTDCREIEEWTQEAIEKWEQKQDATTVTDS